MGLFGHLFDPPEAKLVKLKVETFLRANTGPYGLEIERVVGPMVERADILTKLVKEEKRDPDELALSIIYNKMIECLCSGQYHTYRGMLSGTGNEMLAIWGMTSAALVQRGFVKKEDVDNQRKDLMEEIRSMG